MRLLLHALSPLLILLILGPPAPSPPTPVQRVLLALLVAALNALVAAPKTRGRVAGMLFFWAILSSTLRYGQVLLGLQAEWQRWLAGLLLSAPFLLLVALDTPGALENRLDAWKQRRSRR